MDDMRMAYLFGGVSHAENCASSLLLIRETGGNDWRLWFDDSKHKGTFEFCTYAGGGQSPNTYTALSGLFVAIRTDTRAQDVAQGYPISGDINFGKGKKFLRRADQFPASLRIEKGQNRLWRITGVKVSDLSGDLHNISLCFGNFPAGIESALDSLMSAMAQDNKENPIFVRG